ncbi:MAG: phenylalanine--tRNA ligase subunit beta [Pseudomonadota bacterium]
MKILLKWLHEFLPTQPSASDVANALTSVGLEVSSVKYLAEGFEKVIVAKIVEAQKHPNADRLTVCQVTDGGTTHEIVCGASNFKVGDRVALAQIGAKLPNGLAIKASKIRGVASAGMLCSEAELLFSTDSEGILILPADAPLGKPLAEVLGRDDWLLELELTPNRGDCLSITGIAREVAAALNLPPKAPSNLGEGPADTTLKAEVLEPEGSGRYVLRALESVKVGDSPSWMRQRLEVCGVRSITNVVDVTNYVTLERGQPLHAFDREKIVGTIRVRRAEEGEKIACLDGVERSLKPTDLVIADDHGPVAIAGVIGGARSAVSAETKSVLLESAHFHPKSVRLTAKRLNLHTESSHRFERWVDPASVWANSERAVELLSKTAGARASGGIDVRAKKYTPTKLRLYQREITRILGIDLKNAGECLARLGFAVEKHDQDWGVEVPTRRPDLEREIDLIEEVARIHGFDKIPSSLTPIDRAPIGNRVYDGIEAIRDFCRAAGFQETCGYSFADETELASFASPELGKPVLLSNPLVSEMTRMRQSLLPALLRVWLTNRNRQAKGVRLFEVGTVYGKGDSTNETPAKEDRRLAVLWGGDSLSGSWQKKSGPVDFFDAKGFVEGLAEQIGIRPISFRLGDLPSYFHPGQSARIFWRDRAVGTVGKLHPRLVRELDVGETAILELNLAPFLLSILETERFKPYSQFPVVVRDLSVVLKSDVAWGDVESQIQKLKEPLLKGLELFDLYEGKGIPEGSRSLAFSLYYGSDERTLTDAEVDAAVAKVVSQLDATFGAKLRS